MRGKTYEKVVMKLVLILLFTVWNVSAADKCSPLLDVVRSYEKWLREFPEPSSDKLNVRELTMIEFYTNTEAARINAAMRDWNGKEIIPEMGLKNDIAALISGLKKLPPHTGTVKRFAKGTQEQFEAMIPGHEFNINAFWSSTTLDELPPSLNTQSMNTLFVIQSKKGRNISHLSVHPDEQEVLFLPLTRFRVVSTTPNVNGRNVITLEEID